MNATRLIDHISNFISLTEEEIALILPKLNERQYRKGQYIVQSGDIAQNLNFIVQGAVKKFFVDHTGKEYIMMLGLEDWWAGDMSSFITQSPAVYHIECVEPTQVIRIHRDEHEKLLGELPKMERYFRKVTERAYVSAQDRIIRNFALSAKERYLHFNTKYPEHSNRFPQYMIASYLGITKEFLSKIRSQHL
jgi:CRP-like cAMP-binding protein